MNDVFDPIPRHHYPMSKTWKITGMTIALKTRLILQKMSFRNSSSVDFNLYACLHNCATMVQIKHTMIAECVNIPMIGWCLQILPHFCLLFFHPLYLSD